MNILFIVDPRIPVPPRDYGGIERIVDVLVQDRRNHFGEEGFSAVT